MTPPTPESLLARDRRDRRRLTALDRATKAFALCVVGVYLYLLFIAQVMHSGFVLLGVFGYGTGFLRVLVVSVRDQARTLFDLSSPDPATRAAACAALDAHRAELLGPLVTNLRPAERERLMAAPCADVAAWVAGRTNLWRVGRVVLVVWALLGVTLTVFLLSIDPRFRAS